MKTLKKLKDYPKEKENPFVHHLFFPTKKKTDVIATKNGSAIVNLQTGEVDDNTLFFAQQKFLDKEPFVKLFQSQLRSLFGLSNTGIRLFGYLMEQVQFSDVVLIDWKEAKEYTKLKTDASIQRGLADLLEAGIIARTKYPNAYFINPTVFFKGDRIVLITEYRKKTAKKSNNTNQFSLFAPLLTKQEQPGTDEG